MSMPAVEAIADAPAGPARHGGPRTGVRAQILEAALSEFAAKGFQESSLAAIARRVGVTAPLVLYHFGSKANLWREALEVFFSSFSSVIESAIAEGSTLDSRDALRLVVRRLAQFFAANRSAYRLMRDEGCARTDESDWFTSRRLRPVMDQIEVVYTRAVNEGTVRPAPFEPTLFMILGAISCYLESRGLVSHLFGTVEENEDWIDNYAEQVVALCFDGLSSGTRRTDGVRPMLAALRPGPQANQTAPAKEAATA